MFPVLWSLSSERETALCGLAFLVFAGIPACRLRSLKGEER